MQALPGDVAAVRPAEIADHGSDFLRLAAATEQLPALGMMHRGRRAATATFRLDQAGDDAIDGDAVGGEIVRERLGEAGEPRLGRDDMNALRRAGMPREPADIDDAA